MKTKKLLIAFLLITVLPALTRCSSSDDGLTPSDCNANNGTITAQLDGSDFCANAIAVIPTGFDALDGHAYMVQGHSTNLGLLELFIPRETGTYNMDSGKVGGGYSPDVMGNIAYGTDDDRGGSAVFTIEEVTSTRIKGTFEMVAVKMEVPSGDALDGSIAITNGFFDVALPEN